MTWSSPTHLALAQTHSALIAHLKITQSAWKTSCSLSHELDLRKSSHLGLVCFNYRKPRALHLTAGRACTCLPVPCVGDVQRRDHTREDNGDVLLLFCIWISAPWCGWYTPWGSKTHLAYLQEDASGVIARTLGILVLLESTGVPSLPAVIAGLKGASLT